MQLVQGAYLTTKDNDFLRLVEHMNNKDHVSPVEDIDAVNQLRSIVGNTKLLNTVSTIKL